MKKFIVIMLLGISMVSCIHKYSVPQNVVKNSITIEKLSHNEKISLYSALTLPFGVIVKEVEPGLKGRSDLEWLPVLNKKGELIEIKINRTSTFIIETKNNETVKMLATTTFIEDGILKGKRSLILGMAREVKIEDILDIQIYTENSRVRPITKENEEVINSFRE